MGLGPLLRDIDSVTPRTLIKTIIRLLPPASPVVPGISKHEEPAVAAEEGEAELPTGRLSNMEEMELPELVPEERPVIAPGTTKEKKQLEISESGGAVSQQLVQNQDPSLLDSSSDGSSSMSLESLIVPDTVERRPLRRRVEKHRVIDLKTFEEKVDEDMLRRKAQSHLVDSEMSPGSQTSMLSSVGTGKRRTQGYSQDLILDHEHVDSMTPVSSKLPENPPENKIISSGLTQWSSSLFQEKWSLAKQPLQKKRK
ncbi:centromere protein T-like [Guaruba guarouba]